MSNERLRSAIVEAGMSLAEFGDAVGVDPKTVERWITKERVPHRAHRLKSAGVLGRTDVFLWPTTESDPRSRAAAKAEFVDLYPNRGSVPSSTWVELLDSAHESIDLLAYAGSSCTTRPVLRRAAFRTSRPGRLRCGLLFGDPTSDAVALRGKEEGIGELMAARCSLTWNYLAPILNGGEVAGGTRCRGPDPGGGVQARQHGCTLYASLFRFDDATARQPAHLRRRRWPLAGHAPQPRSRRPAVHPLPRVVRPHVAGGQAARLGVTSSPMGRIDYIDDPAAPAINSVVPSVVAIVRDDEGRVLMIHKTDNDRWALPGGGHEPGESIADTVVREVKEETGYDVEVETITGTYTNPHHVMAYDDGEVRQQFSIAFRAKLDWRCQAHERREQRSRVADARRDLRAGPPPVNAVAPRPRPRGLRPATHRIAQDALDPATPRREARDANRVDGAVDG